MTNPITKETIYITHNDIKPANIIFRESRLIYVPLRYSYHIEYIDYGGFKYSSTFFTKIGTHTPFMYSILYNDVVNKRIMFKDPPLVQITSPLYDIGSAILTIIIMIIGYDSNIINNLLGPIQQSIIDNDYNTFNNEINDVAARLSTAIQIKFGTDIDIADKNKTLKFLYKLMPYIVLICSINVYMYNCQNEISKNLNSTNDNSSNLEFTNFNLIKITTNSKNELINHSIIEIKEKNMEAVHKILDIVTTMSDSI
jgi:serine/threonine protein kinase